VKKLATALFLLFLILSLVGCLPPPKMGEPITLEYLDSGYFENKLSTAMSQELAEIEVRFLSPISTNDIPDRLDAWLTVIGETGGQVQTTSLDGSRNMISDLMLTLYSVYQELKKQHRYEPAQYYNARLLYRRNKSGKAIIEKAVFTHRNLKLSTSVEKPVMADAVPAQLETPIRVGGKHALLIGIENYNHPKITNLGGAINDVKLIKGVLRTRFGFQEDDFTILLDEQATHSGIENAFKVLIERVQPKDFVYIHYAGHGSQTPDLNGDERSGQDQTWVSFGTRQPGREYDKDNYEVLDDEINAWLAAIYAKTDQVIFVSDSCHSATVARGDVPVSRGLKRDERSHPLGRMAYTQLDEYHGIHIGAARDKEFATETFGDDGKRYGIFTLHWAKALQQARMGETWDEVFKRAATQVVSIRGDVQRPQIEGERDRAVFGGHFTPPVATVSVSSVKGEWVKIQAGMVAGVTVGSVYRSRQHPLRRIEITQVGTFESDGKTTAVGAFKAGDLVVEESHAYHFDPIKVSLSADSPNDKPLLQAIQAAFQPNADGTQPLPSYVLTDKPDETDLRLLLRGQPPKLWVLTPDQHLLYKNLQIPFENPNKGVALLQDNLNKLARIREIKALQNSATNPVIVQSYLFSPVEVCSAGMSCVNLPKNLGLHQKYGPYRLHEIGDRTLGDILTFSLHNQSEQDLYCYFINISADGAIYAIFPYREENEEYTLLKAGEKRQLFEEVVLILEQSGEETVKFIASTHPIDVLLLEQEEFRLRGDEAVLNSLERLLVSAAHGLRGLSRVSISDWVTEQVTFEVK